MRDLALERLSAMLSVLPVGVIVVDAEDRVVQWNGKAEEFIACVGRPMLHVGMSLDGAHSDPYRPGMNRMMEGLRSGREFPCKNVSGDGQFFRVSYHALFSDDEEYVGVAQVIEFLEEESV